jgi:hypothetical protein
VRAHTKSQIFSAKHKQLRNMKLSWVFFAGLFTKSAIVGAVPSGSPGGGPGTPGGGPGTPGGGPGTPGGGPGTPGGGPGTPGGGPGTPGPPVYPSCLGGGCTDDVTLQYQLGSYTGPLVDDYDDIPVSIISQDGDTVTFEISHQWGNLTLDKFFVQYYSPHNGGLQVCHKATEDFVTGACLRITASCITSNHVAPITITVVDDDLYATTDGPDLPQACCDDFVISEDHHVVKYIFKLQCDPKDCESDSHCGKTFTPDVIVGDPLPNGSKCQFSEQCESCCCNTKGISGAEVCAIPNPNPIPNELNCCPYALYSSTWPNYGEDCPKSGQA